MKLPSSEVWAYNPESILAEKVETILRRSVLNTRPRDLYDVYILMKSRPCAINKAIFGRVLRATSERRLSQAALQERDKIVLAIQSSAEMQQRWERYCRENYYARGITFDDAMQVLVDLLGQANL